MYLDATVACTVAVVRGDVCGCGCGTESGRKDSCQTRGGWTRGCREEAALEGCQRQYCESETQRHACCIT